MHSHETFGDTSSVGMWESQSKATKKIHWFGPVRLARPIFALNGKV